jgi:hypothetical protein
MSGFDTGFLYEIETVSMINKDLQPKKKEKEAHELTISNRFCRKFF